MIKFFICLFSMQSLFALTTLNVTLNTDNNPGGFGEPGDLRYCLNTMNENLNSSPDDYEILFSYPMTIQLEGILPIINNSSNAVNITIGNPGSIQNVIIDGNNGTYRGFFIPIGQVTLRNLILQNMSAKGGKGGDGIAGGGGGLGAGGAIYIPQFFLNSVLPSVTLTNVLIKNCSAIGGNGGNYIGNASTGNEGGGGGGGFSGDGGSITTTGSTGGGGGGGFGGNGGNVTLSSDQPLGGGGGGGGGIGSKAIIGTLANLGNGGSDQTAGENGNGYGLNITAGEGGGGYGGGNQAGGGGGGNAVGNFTYSGGGGGGSSGNQGVQPFGSIPPGGNASPSGGNGGDGGGGGGVVLQNFNNAVDGKAGSGGYAGGGGGGAGTGSYDTNYYVQGGSGGIGGGGGGGGVNQSGFTPAEGGNSLGGGGGGGGGPSSGISASGGSDIGNLGGGAGGSGAMSVGAGFGGGGGGGGSGLGGAIFIDSQLNLTLDALSGVATSFDTQSTTVEAGLHGLGAEEATDGADGSALGNSLFLRSGSTVTLRSLDINDVLTIGDNVSFSDDTLFGGGGTSISVRGNGKVVYNGISDYQGAVTINNANFEVNGRIDSASVSVCRNIGFSQQRGKLSGNGTLSGNVFVNSGIISPKRGSTLTLGSLVLSPANPESSTLGSLVHIEIDPANSFSKVAINGAASLAGVLEIDVDPLSELRSYPLITASSITGTFDSIVFTGSTPNYYIAYEPSSVQFTLIGFPASIEPPRGLKGKQKKNDFGFEYEYYNFLSWQKSLSEVEGYYIYRDGEKIAQVDSETLFYEDHNRTKGVSYEYAVTAFNETGESAEVTITINP